MSVTALRDAVIARARALAHEGAVVERQLGSRFDGLQIRILGALGSPSDRDAAGPCTAQEMAEQQKYTRVVRISRFAVGWASRNKDGATCPGRRLRTVSCEDFVSKGHAQKQDLCQSLQPHWRPKRLEIVQGLVEFGLAEFRSADRHGASISMSLGTRPRKSS